MFRRAHHQKIAEKLKQLKTGFLQDAHCYFAGGTAIPLLLNEYRESVDIDFLCSSRTGYRMIREAVFEQGIDALFSERQDIHGDIRTDQYGVRAFLKTDDRFIRFEIVFEGRIDLEESTDSLLGVPILSRVDLYTEKLIANADRYSDPSISSRDIIDLAMMIKNWGPIPDSAFLKARSAYGDSIDLSFKVESPP